MADNRNPLLRQAFEEAARKEVNELPAENLIVRPYSKEHDKRMNQVLNGEQSQKKRISFRKAVAAVLAAAFTVTLFSVGTSAMLNSESMQKLFNFTPDPDRYVNTEVEVKDSTFVGEGHDEHYELTFTGEPVVINYKIDEGKTSEEAERGLVLFLNGVRQTFDVKTSAGKVTKDVDMYIIGGKPGEKDNVEITFVPNLGKKGETMALSISCFFDPDDNHKPKCISEKGTYEWHFDDDDNKICDECNSNIAEIPRSTRAYTLQNEMFVHLIMEKDAPQQKKVCTDKVLMRESDVHEKIYMMYDYSSDGETVRNEYDALETMNAVVYKDINETIKDDIGFGVITDRCFITKGETNEKFTLNIHGKPGQYRVAFYIGTDPQPVFGSAENIDVTINEGKQVEIDFELNTQELGKGEHKYYIVYRPIGDNLFEEFWWFEEQVYEGTIEVK